MPVEYEKADIAALRALRDDPKHRRAMEFILDRICDRTGMSYRPGADGDRDTAFAEGRRFVGNQIVKLAAMPLPKPQEDTSK